MNSPYDLLTDHVNKHQYKRGTYLGSAPLDPHRRYNTNKRVALLPPLHMRQYATDVPPTAVVICRATNVLTAHPDGTVALSSGTWRTNLTRDTLNEALARARIPAYVHSRRLFGLSQWCVTTRSSPTRPTPTTYAFYDGMRLSPDGTPLELRPFNARRIDTTQSRPFATGSREFFQALPLLYAASNASAQAYYTHRLYDPATLRRALTSQPELWPAVATWLAHETLTLPEAKLKLAAMVRADLYHTVPTTTTVV